MIGSVLALVLAGFTYVVEVDAFTDARTYVARMTADSSSVEIFCGAQSEGKIAVAFEADGNYLFQSSSGFGTRLTKRVRFGDGEPIEMRFHYRDKTAFLLDDDAAEFASAIQTAPSVTVEFSDYRSRPLIMTFSAKGAADSVSRVISECSTR